MRILIQMFNHCSMVILVSTDTILYVCASLLFHFVLSFTFCFSVFVDLQFSDCMIDLLTITLRHFVCLFFYCISYIVCTIQPLAANKTIIIIIICNVSDRIALLEIIVWQSYAQCRMLLLKDSAHTCCCVISAATQ